VSAHVAEFGAAGDHILKVIEATSRSSTGNLGPERHYCNLETLWVISLNSENLGSEENR